MRIKTKSRFQLEQPKVDPEFNQGATAIIESGNFEGNEEIINNAGNAVLNGSGHYCTSNTTANTYVVYTSGGSTLTINDGYFYSEDKPCDLWGKP